MFSRNLLNLAKQAVWQGDINWSDKEDESEVAVTEQEKVLFSGTSKLSF